MLNFRIEGFISISSRQKNAVAEHKGLFRFHPVMAAHPCDRLLHPENFRSIFQQNASSLHGTVEHEPSLLRRMLLHLLPHLYIPLLFHIPERQQPGRCPAPTQASSMAFTDLDISSLNALLYFRSQKARTCCA